MNDLFTFRFGYLKLAPLKPNDDSGIDLPSG